MLLTLQQTMKVPAGMPSPPFVYIVSSALTALPSPGNRVAPSDAANMYEIVGAGSPHVAIQTAANAHHYRFIGAKVRPAAGQFSTNLIKIGTASEASTSQLPNNIVFDRCYIPGDPTVGGRRAFALNGASCAVIDSYLNDWKENGGEAQAVAVWNSPGPLKIVNNYLEGAAENLLFGGVDPSITNLVPSDLEIRRNYFFKRLSWIGSVFGIKNILEFKTGRRALVEGNVFENIWLAAQTGYLLNAKSVNQDGAATWNTLEDLTFRLNKGLNCENAFTLGGDLSEGVGAALAPTRWQLEHNSVQVANVNGGSGFGVFLAQGASPRYLTHLSFKHNTIVGIRFPQFWPEWGTVNGLVCTDASLMDNIFEGSGSPGGFRGRDSVEGVGTLDDRFTNGTVRYNAWQGRNSALYGAASGSGNTMSNNFFPVTQGDIGFTNYAGGDYSLLGSSTYHNAASDGTDLGADFVLLNDRTLHSKDGQWGSEPPTYSTAAGAVAEIPRTFMDTTYRPQSGAIIPVHAGDDFQAKLNAANIGDTLVVDAGASFPLTLNLPAK